MTRKTEGYTPKHLALTGAFVTHHCNSGDFVYVSPEFAWYTTRGNNGLEWQQRQPFDNRVGLAVELVGMRAVYDALFKLAMVKKTAFTVTAKQIAQWPAHFPHIVMPKDDPRARVCGVNPWYDEAMPPGKALAFVDEDDAVGRLVIAAPPKMKPLYGLHVWGNFYAFEFTTKGFEDIQRVPLA